MSNKDKKITLLKLIRRRHRNMRSENPKIAIEQIERDLRYSKYNKFNIKSHLAQLEKNGFIESRIAKYNTRNRHNSSNSNYEYETIRLTKRGRDIELQYIQS